jgi:hypothetical protein
MPKMKGRVLGKPTDLVITAEQREKLREYTTGRGGRQDLCQRVYDSVRTVDSKLIARVYGDDMRRIQELVEREDSGGWQDLFREILAENGLFSN